MYAGWGQAAQGQPLGPWTANVKLAGSKRKVLSPTRAMSMVGDATRTCRVCHKQYSEAENNPAACHHHTALYTGGEVSKAIGFCRESDAPEHSLRAVVGRTGLIRFWDCCGAEDEAAPGCCAGRHKSYDDPVIN